MTIGGQWRLVIGSSVAQQLKNGHQQAKRTIDGALASSTSAEVCVVCFSPRRPLAAQGESWGLFWVSLVMTAKRVINSVFKG